MIVSRIYFAAKPISLFLPPGASAGAAGTGVAVAVPDDAQAGGAVLREKF
jgi:hypothetical protein